ncbi:MAG: AhpC/TSA family protein [Prevotellaceae bacterium]|jgi:thiol-disulfide isomerase/thioredoxin|nr:AhpC/TSA family protein [Prevotellaceae bacterium]
MKKLIFLPLFILGVFIACNEETPKYEINGTVVGDMNGKTVYLKQLDNMRPATTIDSAVIENGIFIMKGSITSPDVYNISVKDEKPNTVLFVENLPMQVTLDANEVQNSIAVGSPLNDLYAGYLKGGVDYRAKIQDVNKRLREARQAQTDKILTPETKRQFTLDYDKASDNYRNYQYEFINDHPNSIVSAYVLRTIALNLKPEQVENALAKFDSIIGKSYYIRSVKDDLERMKRVMTGQKFVDLKMPDVEGKEIALSDYVGKNKYVMVDFWASWCPDCLEENPILTSLYSKYKSKGFEIVGVSLDRDKENWVNRIKKDKLVWPQMSDLKAWNSEGSYLYNIKFIPGNVLIDETGTIIAKDVYDEALIAKLAELFAGN